LAVSSTTLLAALLVLTGHDELADSRSAAPILSRVVSQRGPIAADVPFYSVKMYDQTLPWYLGRTVTPVAHLDELAMGLAIEPDRRWRRWPVGSAGTGKPKRMRSCRSTCTRCCCGGRADAGAGRDPRRVIVSRR
jgi:hypothetical protein